MSSPDSGAIPFNRSSLRGRELEYIFQTITVGQIAGDQTFSKKCHALLERELGVQKALVTTSCTHALEMAAILLGIESGDEVMQLDTLEKLGHLWEKLHKIGGQEAVDQFYAELHPAPPRRTPTWAWLAGGMAVAAVLWTCLRSLARHQPRI